MSWRDTLKNEETYDCISCTEKYTASEMSGNECKYCMAADDFTPEIDEFYENRRR